MNKLVCSALAATVVGATGFAGTGNDSWASLDRELDSLSATLSAQSGGPQLFGWVIAALDWNMEDVTVDNDGEPTELRGFSLRSARLGARGSIGNYGYVLSAEFLPDGQTNPFLGDFAGGFGLEEEEGIFLQDAYATWNIGDVVSGRFGQFKPPTLSSFLISRNRLLFLDRTFIGNTFERDLGIQFSGDFETVGWWIAAHNGESGQADDNMFTARVAVDLLGDGAGTIEGAYGAADAMGLTLAAFFQDDTAFDDGTRWGAEARLTAGPFSAAAEFVDNDTDLGDSSPWNATVSYLFTEQYEAALRWEDFDDAADTQRISIGVNRYVSGHDVKWTLQWSTGDSDVEVLEADVISLGLAVSF